MKQLKHLLYACLPGWCLLCMLSACGYEPDGRVCPGFRSEPFVSLRNDQNKTYLFYVISGKKEVGPFIAAPGDEIRLPLDMTQRQVLIRVESGSPDDYFALNYSFEVASCISDDDLRLTFKTLQLDPHIGTFRRLYVGPNPQEKIESDTDLAFWFKYNETRKAREAFLQSPLIIIQ